MRPPACPVTASIFPKKHAKNRLATRHKGETHQVCPNVMLVHLCVCARVFYTYTLRQMGVICHSGWVSVWWSDCISRVNADGEPGPPPSTNTCSRETVATSELTGKMMEKVREENWALWTYIIESERWKVWEETGQERGRTARLNRKVRRFILFPILPTKHNQTQNSHKTRRKDAAALLSHTPTCCQGETSPISVLLMNDVNLFSISGFHTVYWKLAIQMLRTCWSSAFLKAERERQEQSLKPCTDATGVLGTQHSLSGSMFPLYLQLDERNPK